MKIKLHSYYDHFPNHKPLPFEGYIDCYNDVFCMREEIQPNSIALLIEPRPLQPEVYSWIEVNYNRFRYVFTHDSKLLKKCSNAKLILWGFGNGNYTDYNDIPKTKNVSMVCSDKEMCCLHKARKLIANELKNNPDVDVMGTVGGGEFVDTKTIYAPYRFSVAFENHIDDYWFTEKICNCFANKTIPIYYGARKITDYFSKLGIIRVSHWEDIPAVIDSLSRSGFEKMYQMRHLCIEGNYERVKKLSTFENWFFDKYESLLEGMLND